MKATGPADQRKRPDQHVPEAPPVEHDHGQDRAQLDDDLERPLGLAVEAEQFGGEHEVPGRGDRDELGHALDDSEQDDGEEGGFHLVSRHPGESRDLRSEQGLIGCKVVPGDPGSSAGMTPALERASIRRFRREAAVAAVAGQPAFGDRGERSLGSPNASSPSAPVGETTLSRLQHQPLVPGDRRARAASRWSGRSAGRPDRGCRSAAGRGRSSRRPTPSARAWSAPAARPARRSCRHGARGSSAAAATARPTSAA